MNIVGISSDRVFINNSSGTGSIDFAYPVIEGVVSIKGTSSTPQGLIHIGVDANGCQVTFNVEAAGLDGGWVDVKVVAELDS